MTASSGQEWGPRIIPDSQLIYVMSGQAILYLGPERFTLGSGDCVFYGPKSPHKLVSDKSEPFTFASIHFEWNSTSLVPIHPMPGIQNCTPVKMTTLPSSYKVHIDGHGDVMLPHCFSQPNLESMFTQIVREYRFEEHGYLTVLKGLLTQLVAIILRYRINGENSSATRRKIAPALEMIRKQPHINWTSSELAHLCGYHPTYFSTLFKETIGHSPKHYLVLERIRKAKQLLIETATVEEVAYKLGYASIHYFCRNFKAVTGLTPTEFKLQSIEL